MALFVLSFIFPRTSGFYIADVFLTPQRVLLVVISVICGMRLLKGYRFSKADVFLLLYISWGMFCALLNYGMDRIGINIFIFITYFSCYFFAQIYVRSISDVRNVVRLFFILILFFGALAVPEAVFKIRYIPDFFASISGIPDTGKYVERLGLLRAKTVFAHPINYGLFSASMISYVWYCARTGINSFVSLTLTLLCAFLALSSGPILAALVQIGLIVVERMSRWLPNRGTVILVGLAILYVILEIASKGPFIQVLLTRFTLDPWTAYYRLLIFENMSDDILRHPIFGFRVETWTRLFWMTPSVDNFWLMITARSGFPAPVLLIATLSLIIRQLFIVPEKEIVPELVPLRRAGCFTLIGLCICGTTVHLFGKMEVLFAFQMGLAAAISRMVESPDYRVSDKSEEAVPEKRRGANRDRKRRVRTDRKVSNSTGVVT